MWSERRRATIVAAILLLTRVAASQSALSARTAVPVPPAPKRTTAVQSDGLLGRLGGNMVDQLLSSENAEERLRGVQRALDPRHPDGVALLVSSFDGPQSAITSDARALILVARALAPRANDPIARKILIQIANAATPAIRVGAVEPTSRYAPPGEPVTRPIATDDVRAQTEMARIIAARAIIRAGETEALVSALRSETPGFTAITTALRQEGGRLPALVTENTSASSKLMGFVRESLDLRELPALRKLLAANENQNDRPLLLDMLAAFADGKSKEAFMAASSDPKLEVRISGVRGLLSIHAPEGPAKLIELFAIPEARASVVELSERTRGDEITKSLAALLAVTPDGTLRRAAVHALGVQDSRLAVDSLQRLADDGTLRSDVARALGSCTEPSARTALEAWTRASGEKRRFGVRGLLVRSEFESASSELERGIDALSRSKDVVDRALATFSKIALGRGSLKSALTDPEAKIRRAALMAAQGTSLSISDRDLSEQWEAEQDPIAKELYAGLFATDLESRLSELSFPLLSSRVLAGGTDLPVVAIAIAARGKLDAESPVRRWLKGSDLALRIAAVRGLAARREADGVGLLLTAFAFETSPVVREIMVRTLGARDMKALSPFLEETAALDPDPAVRLAAKSALGSRLALTEEPKSFAWIRVTDGDATPAIAIRGSLLTARGFSLPVVFDDDGIALVPHLPRAQARVTIAPALPPPPANIPAATSPKEEKK